MNLDSDTDQPMHTPPTNSPPSSGDERSPPSSPQQRAQNRITELGPGVLMQVNEYLADNGGDGSELTGKKKREEREMVLAAQAENEKLLDKDWREAWLKRWEDDFDEKDMKTYSAGSTTLGGTEKGKEPETAE